jgi:hypothetical protein
MWLVPKSGNALQRTQRQDLRASLQSSFGTASSYYRFLQAQLFSTTCSEAAGQGRGFLWTTGRSSVLSRIIIGRMSIVNLAALAQGLYIPIRLGNFAACINDDIDANAIAALHCK